MIKILVLRKLGTEEQLPEFDKENLQKPYN